MAKSKVRMTVFSRFLLFMLIVVPSAYFGVSYLRGEDGLANLKEAVGIEATTSSSDDSSSSTSSSSSTRANSEIARLKDDLKEKDERIEELYLENETLRKRLKDNEEQLEKFKEKLEVLLTPSGN